MRFIRLKEVINLVGLSRSSIYKFMQDGVFPKNVSLGGNSVAWIESEVHEWMKAKLKERNQE